MNIFVDKHHSGLTESLYALFEGRLGHELYTPIGLAWFEDGYWKLNDSPETARQYLMPGTIPSDGTGAIQHEKTLTMDQFRDTPIDIVIASIPQHVEPFRRLAEQKGAKFVLQVGNNWDWADDPNLNVLAAIAPRPTGANVCWYHEEFNTAIYHESPAKLTKKVYSFVNVLKDKPEAYDLFVQLEQALPDWEFKMYGGQNRDGNLNGDYLIAQRMREATYIFHVKPGGDGFGHILHQAYATGRPIITRSKDYEYQLGSQLMKPGTFLDLDLLKVEGVAGLLRNTNDSVVETQGRNAAETFQSLVNYEREAQEVSSWLAKLK